MLPVRYDRVYLLAFLIPVSLYDLVLEFAGVLAREEAASLLRTVGLMRPHLFLRTAWQASRSGSPALPWRSHRFWCWALYGSLSAPPTPCREP